MSDIDWSKAPEGATHYNGNKSRGWRWMQKSPGGQWFFFHEGDQEWRAQGGSFPEGEDKLVERPASAWTGTGLPPVGTVCEVDYCEKWCRCEVIAHFQQRKGIVAAFTVNLGDGVKALDAFGAEYFRPIRTPEQIAKEERKKAIEKMEPIAADAWRNCQGGDDMITCICVALYDSGYRKTEAP